jgi:hypothetical protein
MTVAGFVGAGVFLVRYFNGHTKYSTRPIKEAPQLFLTNIIHLIKK